MIVTEIQADTIVKTRNTAYVQFTYEFDGKTIIKDYEYTEHVDYVGVDSMKFYKILYYDYYGHEQLVKITNENYSKYDFGVKIKVD
jgi:hypothetical protein